MILIVIIRDQKNRYVFGLRELKRKKEKNIAFFSF